MPEALTIGDFSRMTHLSVKTLRHYHEVGLLEPVAVDPTNGYRRYSLEQVPVAQVIRRFRELRMPVEDVRAVLAAPDLAARNAIIAAHLDRLTVELAQTQASVASLRGLLERPVVPITVEHRAVPALTAIGIAERVGFDGVGAWWTAAVEELAAFVRATGARTTGPAGALWPAELFDEGAADVVVFVPVDGPPTAAGRVGPVAIPAAELAVTVHRGTQHDIDLAYAALGAYVTEHAIGVEGPIRERYLVGPWETADATTWVTEVGWPVFLTADR